METRLKELINEHEITVNYLAIREEGKVICKTWSGEDFIEVNTDNEILKLFQHTKQLNALLNVHLSNCNLSDFLMNLSETLELITVEDNATGLSILLR